MKHTKKLVSVLVLTLVMSLVTPSICPFTQATVSAATKNPKLSKTKLQLEKGKKATLKLKNAKASKVKWSSKNKKVATVSKKGVVAAKNAGTTKVTAKYGKKNYTCTVKVVNSTAPVVTPAPVVPVVTPAPVVPVVTPAPAAPVVTPAPAAPVVTPAPATPVVTPTPAAPVVTPAPTAPVVTPAPTAPVVTPDPGVPAPTPDPDYSEQKIPVEVKNPNAVFNGGTIQGMTVTTMADSDGVYSFNGTFTNTSKYELDEIYINVTGYAQDGTPMTTYENGWVGYLDTLKAGQSCTIEDIVVCNAGVSYFVIDSIEPSFKNIEELVDVSNIVVPDTCSGNAAQGLTISDQELLAYHNNGTFDNVDAEFSFTLNYTLQQYQDVSIRVICCDKDGKEIYSSDSSDDFTFGPYNTSIDLTCYLNEMPANTASIKVEVTKK